MEATITAIIVLIGMLYGFYEGRRFEHTRWMNTFSPKDVDGATSTGSGADDA